MLMNLIYQKTIVLTVHLNFSFILTFESLFSIWKFLIFIFCEKKKNSGKLHQNRPKKCWHAVQKSKKRKTVQAYFII